MPTPYEKIHQAALAQITDRDILKYTDAEKEGIFDEYLVPSIVAFKRVCRTDLSDRDETLKQFKQDLSDEDITILATGEVYRWCLPRVNNIEHMRIALNTKEFNQTSPQGILSQLQTLRDFCKNEFKQSIIDYSYANGDIQHMKV
ncbi:MAG: hypothetical protein RR806_03160 [Oscillospiraceae bacterium]